MNTAEIISLSSSIAAFITSGIALVNVVELNKQRKQSLLPEIIFKDVSFNIYMGDNTVLPIKWIKTSSKLDSEAFSMECYNIGLGAAKSIKLTWSYDIQLFIDTIHRNNNDNVYQIEFNQETQIIDINMKSCGLMTTKNDMQNKKEYILPASIY